MGIFIPLLSFVLISSTAMAANVNLSSCADQALANKGWQVQSKKVISEKSNYLEDLVTSNPLDYTVEGVYKMYSSQARSWVELTSVDSSQTPSDEMSGDILWIRDLDTQKVIEIRWYENNKIYVLYNNIYQPCATNLIPFVDNSLF